MKKLNRPHLKRIVVSGNRTQRLQFRRHFDKEISLFAEAIFKAYQLYEAIEAKEYDRKAVVKLFLYTAIQNLISAFNIFISGYLVPSGNLMRHFHESVAWAILFSTKKLNFYDNFMKDKDTISFQKGPIYVQRHITKFNINCGSWQTFIRIMKFYDKFSHSTAFAVASNFIFAESRGIALGSHFDSVKLPKYKEEITRMISAANVLENIIVGIKHKIEQEDNKL